MSKLKFLIGTLVVSGFAVAMTASAACDLGVSTLKVGSKGVSVSAMQSILGVNPDGNFGPMTKAAVVAWQANHGLVADGIVGAMTRSAMAATCGATVVTTPTTPTTTVSGGAGDLTIDGSTKDVESSMKEGEEDVKVLGFKVKAEDSDISISNVKVFLQNDGAHASSEKLTRYVDSVKILLGDEEVGSADASDFSKSSKTWDTFEKSIATSGAVVKEGKTAYLYVAVSAVSSIDTNDQDAKWNVAVTAMRYTDGTGAIMSADTADADFSTGTNPTISAVDGAYDNFGFTDETTDDNLTIKSSSANPATSTIGVDSGTDTTDDVLIGAFKLEASKDSSDITVTELPIKVTFTGNGSKANFANDVIKELYVKIDGEEYQADLDDADDETTGGASYATYYVTLDDGELVIAGDDTVEVKIYASFEGQDDGDQYAEGTTVKASIADDTISAEGSDELDNDQRDGSFLGKEHTLSAVDITVAEGSAVSPKYSLSDKDTKVEYTLNIKVTNDGDDDIYIPFGAIRAADWNNNAEGLAFVLEDSAGTDYTSGSVSISVEAEDGDIEGDDAFLISADGEAHNLILKVTLDNAGQDSAKTLRLALTDVAYTTDDVDGTHSGKEVTDDLTNIRTATYSIGKYIN